MLHEDGIDKEILTTGVLGIHLPPNAQHQMHTIELNRETECHKAATLVLVSLEAVCEEPTLPLQHIMQFMYRPGLLQILLNGVSRSPLPRTCTVLCQGLCRPHRSKSPHTYVRMVNDCSHRGPPHHHCQLSSSSPCTGGPLLDCASLLRTPVVPDKHCC